MWYLLKKNMIIAAVAGFFPTVLTICKACFPVNSLFGVPFPYLGSWGVWVWHWDLAATFVFSNLRVQYWGEQMWDAPSGCGVFFFLGEKKEWVGWGWVWDGDGGRLVENRGRSECVMQGFFWLQECGWSGLAMGGMIKMARARPWRVDETCPFPWLLEGESIWLYVCIHIVLFTSGVVKTPTNFGYDYVIRLSYSKWQARFPSQPENPRTPLLGVFVDDRYERWTFLACCTNGIRLLMVIWWN